MDHLVEECAITRLVDTTSCASPLISDSKNMESLTLRREWALFSGLPTCNASLSLATILLSEGTLGSVQEIGIHTLRELLDWRVSDLYDHLGEDRAEEVLEVLTTYGAEVRLLPDPGVLLRPARSDNQTQVLEERWGDLPISVLNLDECAVRAMKRASVVTISDMLFVLDPLHVELALDPHAFMVIWKTLEKLGLRQESFEDAGERLSAEAYERATLDHIVASWQKSKGAYRWPLISRRFGLTTYGAIAGRKWEMPTLEQVAAEFSLTRERVRQIEARFIKLVINRNDDYFAALCNAMWMIIHQAGGIISLRQAIDDFKEWFNSGKADPEGFCRLILNYSPTIVSIKKRNVFALTAYQASLFQIVVDIAESITRLRFEEYSLDDLAVAVENEILLESDAQNAETNHFSLEFIKNCLKAAGCFDESVQQPMPIILVRILREMGSPRHFNEITDQINESGLRKRSSSAKYVHHNLITRRDLFVHVSAGTYGLVEWGLEDRRLGRNGEPIGNIMTNFLEARGIPASKEEIIDFVLSQKNCRGASVVQSLLYDPRFHRFDKNKYGLSKWTF